LLLDPGADLIIADQVLPDGSGTDLVGATDASVLLVTAADDPATVQRALVRGVIGYIVKPFGLATLADRVADYVRFRETLAHLAAPDQAAIDDLIARVRFRTPPAVSLPPKGRSAVTGTAIADLLRDSPGPLTAVAVADVIGISRATAQRYLSDLVDAGHVVLSLRYGTAGRPEHSYSWTQR
jgi:two-component system CitB family response regulator